MVIPAAKRLSGVGSRSIPGGDPAHVQRLIDAVNAISRRLESADLAHSRITACPQSLADAMARVHHQMSEEFARWGQLGEDSSTAEEKAALRDLAHEVEHSLDRSGAAATEAIYASLGGMRGLVDAMRDAQTAIDGLDWKLLTRVQFG